MLYSKSGPEARIRQLESVLDKATSLVQRHHSQQLMTSVLHDADSHNWADDKEFFEVNSYVFPCTNDYRIIYLLSFKSWNLFISVCVWNARVLSGRTLFSRYTSMESVHAWSAVRPRSCMSSTPLSTHVQFSVEVVVVALCLEILSSPAIKTSYAAVCVCSYCVSPFLQVLIRMRLN